MTKFLLFALLIVISCKVHQPSIAVNPYQYTANKKIVCQKGAVVSAHPLASKVGIEMMKHGGNAIDAAIATQLALAVVYPGAGNIGGGGFMVARLANGQTLALDYREAAPATAYRDMYLDENGNVISAHAVSGHPLLQAVAVAAARGARFSPTKLSGQPVKVTGVITYNFVAQ